jgi:hypothetical protein
MINNSPVLQWRDLPAKEPTQVLARVLVVGTELGSSPTVRQARF